MKKLRVLSISFLFCVYSIYNVCAFYPTYHEITANKELAKHFSSTESPNIQTSRLEVKDENTPSTSPLSQTTKDFEMTSGTTIEEVKNRKSNDSERNYNPRSRYSYKQYEVALESNRKSQKYDSTGKTHLSSKHRIKDSVKEEEKEESLRQEGHHDVYQEDPELKMIPMHLLQHTDHSLVLSRQPQQYDSTDQIHLYPESYGSPYSTLQAEHRNNPRYYDYDYDLAYRSDFYWLIPLVIIIGIGALLLPLCSLFMTTMVSNGAINLTGRRRRRSISDTRDSLSNQVLQIVTKVEEALIHFSKYYSIDSQPEL